MAVDVFRDRVNYDIRTVVKRILQVRTQEGVVDYDHDTVTMCHSRHIPNIDQTHGRIAWRFDPDEFGFVGPNHVRHI